MKTFCKKWNGVAVEDDGAYMSAEAKSFAKAFKNMLRRELGRYGIEVTGFSIGHYYLSGFLKLDDSFVYFSYNVPRWGHSIDFFADSFLEGVLYREALDEKDLSGHGGNNQYCSIDNLPNAILEMFARKLNRTRFSSDEVIYVCKRLSHQESTFANLKNVIYVLSNFENVCGDIDDVCDCIEDSTAI